MAGEAKQIQSIPLDTIGVNGLDTQKHPTALGPNWFTKADNIVYTEGNRVTFRKGLYQKTNPEANGNHIGSLYENRADGTIWAAAGQYIYEVDFSNTDGSGYLYAFTNAYDTGASNDHWQFADTDLGLVAVQEGEDVQLLSGGSWGLMSADAGYSAPAGVTTFDPSTAL